MNSVGCQRYVGWEYYEQGNLAQASERFERAASAGDAESMFGLACVLIEQQNYESALEHLKQSSGKGYMRSTYWIAAIYEHGLAGDRNIERAREYYSKAAKSGYLIAERALLNLTFKHGSVVQKLSTLPALIGLTIRSFFVAARDRNDERLADIRNAFEK